jgi:hypothetical protein
MTSEQIQKLKSLGELLASGTITKEEFNSLKSEILNEKSPETNQIKNDFPKSESIEEIKSTENDKKKIRLVGFHNSTTGKRVAPPKIEFLNIDKMTKEEENQLRAFLRLKQIFSPSNMTNDEIKIGNKLFTRLEIERFNSERPGLNFPWAVIISVLTAGLSLFLMYISPCFGFLGAGTGMVSATAISIFVLTRVSATKLDKILSVIAIILSIGAFIAYQSHFKGNTWELKDSEQTTESSNNDLQTSFASGDELFDYISFGYYGYSDLVQQWGEATVGSPYLNDRKDGFNVTVEWSNVNVNGSVPSFEFSVSESDGESPIAFKGFTVDNRIFEY